MSGAAPVIGTPTILADVDAATWTRLSLAPWVIAPADPQRAHALVLAGLADGARVTAAVVGSAVVGLAVSHVDAAGGAPEELLALGVAPDHRRQGLAGTILAAHASDPACEHGPGDARRTRRRSIRSTARVRAKIARRLLTRAGYRVESAAGAVRSVDPAALVARREPA